MTSFRRLIPPTLTLALALAAGCGHGTDGPQPTLTAVDPQAACNDQVASKILVTGSGLSPLNDHTLLDKERLELPQFTLRRTQDIKGNPTDPTSVENVVTVPNDPDHPDTGSDETWSNQMSMAFAICPPGTCSAMPMPTPPLVTDYASILPTGLFSLEVQNRTGGDTTLDNAIAIVPVPQLKMTTPDLLCTDDDNTVTLSGDFFYVYTVNGKTSQFDVKIGDHVMDQKDVTFSNCRPLPHPIGFDLQACQTATVKIPAKTFPVTRPTVFTTLPVEIIGPAPIACHSIEHVAITFVPEPALDKIVPDILCDAQDARMVELDGFGFLSVQDPGASTPRLPTANFGSTQITATPVGMAPPCNAPTCTQVGVTNNPALPPPRETVFSYTTLTVQIAQGKLPPTDTNNGAIDDYPTTVTNPMPANCTTHPALDTAVTPPPSLITVVPDLVCNAQGDTHFTLTGTGFIGIDTAVPSVTITDATGKMTTLMGALTATSCTADSATPAPREMLKTCTELTIDVPAGALATGTAKFVVTNPDPAGCASTESITIVVVPPPVVTSAMPSPVCTAEGDVPLLITGMHFLTVDGTPPTVTLTDVAGVAPQLVPTMVTATGCMNLAGPPTIRETVADCTGLTAILKMGSIMVGATYKVTVTNPMPANCTSQEDVTVVGAPPPTNTSFAPTKLCQGGGSITLMGTNFEQGATVSLGPLMTTSVTVSQSGSTATASFGAGLSPGMYSVGIQNPDGCSATAMGQVTVALGRIVFFADPPTVWNGINTQITVYSAQGMVPITGISIAPTGTTQATALTNVVANGNNRATAVVPLGTPAGTYDILVDDGTCPAVLTGGLKVVSQTSFTVTSINPAYGYNQANTAVTILSNGAFVATPRAYLSAGGANAATALSAVAFVDASTLTAVVPASANLPVGKYNLIVVNPDGTVGVLKAAFSVIANPTPIITSLQPGSVPTTTTPFTVVGNNFAANATVSGQCFALATGTAIGSGALTGTAPTTCGASQCIQVAGVPFGGPGFCVITVTNPSDGSSFDFSSLVITNSGQKLGTFTTAASTMNTGRRALGLVAGQATPAARFLYALGGDTGTEAMALDTVEAATVDIFGKLGKWITLRGRLNKPRTFVGAVTIDRFLYLVGGSDGTGAVSTVERAYILDPNTVPTFTDLNFDLPPMGQNGLSGGTYYYRVAAVMANGDAFNPNGENLPSDPFVLLVPSLTNGVYLTLTWSAVTGADHYRLYRSPTANLAAGSEQLIADNLKTTSYQDTGATPILINGAPLAPLPIGSLGSWVAMPSLAVAASGAAVAAATDPVTPSVSYIYAMGGNSGTAAAPVPTAVTGFLQVTVNADTSQTAGSAWTAGPNLSAARWQTTGYGISFGGTSTVWAGTGLGVTVFEGATIAAGTGMPAAFQATTNPNPSPAGYAGVAINDFLYSFGGPGGGPGVDSKQAQSATPPLLGNFSNSTFLVVPRYLDSGTVESGFIFVCGGDTGAGISNSCDTTIW
jgi:hypothetical protein